MGVSVSEREEREREEKRMRDEPLRPRFCGWLDERDQIVRYLRRLGQASPASADSLEDELADRIDRGEHWKIRGK